MPRIIVLAVLFALAGCTYADTLQLRGKATIGGRQFEHQIQLSDGAEYLNTIQGHLALQTGFDGVSFWRTEDGAGPFEVDFAEKEAWTIMHWVLSGYWRSADAPIEWLATKNGRKPVLRLQSGLLEFEVDAADEQDNRPFPTRLVTINAPNPIEIRFSGAQKIAQQVFPKRVSITGIGRVDAFTLDGATRSEGVSRRSYQKPALTLAGVSYDNSLPSQIEVKQASSGHLFVKPRIKGVMVGWFLFDSGAGITLLAPEWLGRLGFARVGDAEVGGIGGKAGQKGVYRGGPFQLGPLQIDDLNFVEYDSEKSRASGLLGEPVVGVIGWDLLLRAVVEVDLNRATMHIHDPRTKTIPTTIRQRLYLHWQVPYVEATFERVRKGMFMFDTGAGKKGVFFPHFTVKQLDLLSGRDLTEGVARGAGGTVAIVEGELASFTIGGHTSQFVPARFSMEEDFEGDIFAQGFLGGAVVEPFRVILDYQRNQIGFLRREL